MSRHRSLLLVPLALGLTALPGLADRGRQVAPYLQRVTTTSAVVMWESPEASVGSVRLADGRLSQEAQATKRHRVLLGGLHPAAEFPYQAFSGQSLAGSGRIKTPPQGPGKVRFAIIGDTGSGNPNQKAVAEQLKGYHPDFVLHVGDVVYDSGEERLYVGRFFKPFAPTIANAPIYPSLGNHDKKTSEGGPYLEAFDLPSETSGTERYYSFTWGEAEFFALDTTDRGFLKPGTAQAVWLEKALKASKARWKIAYGHHPVFSNGADGGKDFLKNRALPLFERYGLDVYVNGHEHNYERFLNPVRGVHFLITGGGGAWLRPGKNKYQDKDKPSIYKDVYHFVGAELDGNRLKFTAIDKEGRAFDEVTYAK